MTSLLATQTSMPDTDKMAYVVSNIKGRALNDFMLNKTSASGQLAEQGTFENWFDWYCATERLNNQFDIDRRKWNEASKPSSYTGDPTTYMATLQRLQRYVNSAPNIAQDDYVYDHDILRAFYAAMPLKIKEELDEEKAQFSAMYSAHRAVEIAIQYYRCLLYTSPSPRDRTRSRMPSSA